MEKSKQSGDAVPQGVYRRSMNRSRLVFTSKELTPDAFAMHMLEANHIPGILESTFSYMDSSMQQSFDVTSHQPLTAFEHRLSHADMIRIWEGVLALTSELDRYLLDGRHLLLQPEYLFFGGKKRQLKACYIPFFERGLPEQLEELAEYALAQAFPEDRRAIVLAYRVRNAAAGGELDMAELRRILLEEEADLREEEPPEEETYSRFPEEQKEQKKRSSGKMLTAAVRLTLFPEKATVTAALAAAMAFLAMYAIRHRRALSTDLPFLLGLGALTAVLLLVSAVNRWREHAAERAAGVGNEKKGAGRAARETDLPEAAYLQPPVLPARGDGRSMLLADPGKDDSGQHNSKSVSASKCGPARLRKTLFQIMSTLIQKMPPDDPVYKFLDKKRSEGKPYYVYMTAGANKFLRIYYGKVKEYMRSLETEQSQS